MKKLFLFVFVFIMMVTGCATTLSHKVIFKSEPQVRNLANEYFEVQLWPWILYESPNRILPQDFILNIKNKTNKNLEIVWDKSLYIDDGRTNGGFMFEGIIYKDRNNSKPPDIVFPNQTFHKTIYPCNLVKLSSGKYGKWEHGDIGLGEQGIYLTVRIGDKEINEKVTVNIEYTSIPLQ